MHKYIMGLFMNEISQESILNCKNEKEIQRQIQQYIERNSGIKMIEEEFLEIPYLNSTKFILMDSFTHNNISVIGLKEQIKKLNKNIINKYPHLEESLIVNKIASHFEQLHNKENNCVIKDAIFNYKSKHTQIEFTDLSGKAVLENYRLISFENNNLNEILFIKEKRIKMNGFKQLPDFAIYLNGIPLLTIEVKTLKSGLDQAFKDYKEKKSYQKFIGCIGTDGIKAFLTTAPQSFSYFYWDTYGDNINKLYSTPFERLLNEIVFNKENLMFYFKFCVFEEKSLSGNYLVNHRVQQYYTLKKFDTMLGYLNNNSDDAFKKVVKHVQRSGKSITIKSVVNLISIKYPDKFKKIYINVPDTVIAGGITRTFGDMKIPGTGKIITVINSRQDYIRSVKENTNDLKVYLMNIQKIPTNVSHSYKKKDVLIIIDEVHTHQQGKLAQVRLKNFPNASMLTFTATPRMKVGGETIRNTTNEIFSDDNSYLDEFNATDALHLGIVLPIVYEKTSFDQIWNQNKNIAYDRKIYENVEKFIKEDSRIASIIESELEDYEEKLADKDISSDEYDKMLDEYETHLKERERGKINRKILEEEVNYVKRALIPAKTSFIIKDIIEKREKSFSDLRGNILFPTKSFWCVDSIEQAIEIMNYVRENASDPKHPTTLNGVRFGTDFSKRTEENRNFVSLEDLNGNILYGDKVISDFESEKEHCIDVLVIVGKYLMGYDEKKLVTIYLDTVINEPARLFQLITRPGTARPDKPKGFVVDLTMDERNYETFKQALAWYDSEKGINTFVLTQDIINDEISNINTCIAAIFKLLNINANNVSSEGLVFGNLLKLDLINQMTYFNYFRSINQSFKILVSPSYYFNSLDTFYHLLQVNKMYYDGLGKPQVIYDKNLIKQIIEETFVHLKMKSINDIVDFKLLEKNIRLYDKDRLEELEYTNKFHKAKLFAQNNPPPSLGRSFYEWLEERLTEIAISNMRSKETQEQLLDIEKRIEEEKARINQIVKKEFDSDFYHFYVYDTMLEHCQSMFNSDLLKDNPLNYKNYVNEYNTLVKSISKIFSDIIIGKMRMHIPSEDNLDSYIEDLLEHMQKDWASAILVKHSDLKQFIVILYKNVFSPKKDTLEFSMLDMVLSKAVYSMFNHYKNGES